MNSNVYKIYEMVDNFCKSNDSNILPSSVVRYIKSCDLSNMDYLNLSSLRENREESKSKKDKGMYYTNKSIIHKVIDPLFLDKFNARFDTCDTVEDLLSLKRDISEVTVLDPSCGGGNFLVESYISLVEIERKILNKLKLYDGYINTCSTIKVSNFIGIEIDRMSCLLAQAQLYIAKFKFNINDDSIPNIVNGDSLCLDWNKLSNSDISYIIGNPPYCGGNKMSKESKYNKEKVIKETLGVTVSDIMNSDYSVAWIYKAASTMRNTKTRTAFVLPYSVTKGMQANVVWKPLLTADNPLILNFAHSSIDWQTMSKGKVRVYCCIIGFSYVDNKDKFIDNTKVGAEYISQHLTPLNNLSYVFIDKREMPKGLSIPSFYDGNVELANGGLILSSEERYELINNIPEIDEYIKPYFSSKDMLYDKNRYCLWFDGVDNSIIQEFKENEFIKYRFDKVSYYRKGRSNREPYLFHRTAYKDKDFIAFPRVFSTNYKYLPVKIFNKGNIVTNSIIMSYEAELFHFALLSSRLHYLWAKMFCGRLKTDYRYSVSIVYNNFPWPDLSDNDKLKLTESANNILKARNCCPNKSLHDLYCVDELDDNIAAAHRDNDELVMSMYGFNPDMGNEEILDNLIKLAIR